MNKEYFIPKTSLWFIAKLIIYVLAIILLYKYIYVIILIDFSINWLIHGYGPIDFIKSYWQGIQDILFNKKGSHFVVGLYEGYIRTKDEDFLYDEVKSYEVSRGGSEPYITLKTGRRIDLNISWLKKEEKQEIEAYLQKRIHG